MTSRQRVEAALRRLPVDRPPLAFWRHVPEVDHDPRRLADAMLTFHDRWSLDLIKVMPSGVYCVEDWGCKVAWTGAASGAKQCTAHAVQTVADWSRITPLDPGAGALGRELEAVHRIARRRADDAPVLHTLFCPLTIARKLAGDRVREDLRAKPDQVRPALNAITTTMIRYAAAALEAGADGLFFATQTASAEVCTEEESATWGLPYARQVLESVRHRANVILLHVHGRKIFFDQVAALPAHAVNWHDRLTAPTLREAQDRCAGAVAGGLNEGTTLREGPPAAIADQVRDAIRQTDGRGLIVAPGCGLPLDVPDEHLRVIGETVRALGTPRSALRRPPGAAQADRVH